MMQKAAGEDGASGLRRVTARETAAVIIAAIGETLVVMLTVRGYVALGGVLVAHACVVAACAAVLLGKREPGSDLALAAIILLLVAIAGPAGTLPLLASLPFARMREGDADVVNAWYERLARAGKPSDTTQTYERIASGRVHRLDTAPPVNFLDVIRSGGMEERQRALGLIARHFHPDYAPVLEAALRSPEPVVRVQAAAVVARVREDLKAKVALLSRPGARVAAQALADAGELQALQTCPMVAPPQQAVCRDSALALMREALAQMPDMVHAVPLANRDTLAALEAFFIAERRFKDLRVMRRVANSSSAPLRLVRRRSSVIEAAA